MASDNSYSYEVTRKNKETGKEETITRTISKSSKGRTRTIRDSSGAVTKDYGGGFRTKVSDSGKTVVDTTGVREAASREKERVSNQVQAEDIRRSRANASQEAATQEAINRTQTARDIAMSDRKNFSGSPYRQEVVDKTREERAIKTISQRLSLVQTNYSGSPYRSSITKKAINKQRFNNEEVLRESNEPERKAKNDYRYISPRVVASNGDKGDSSGNRYVGVNSGNRLLLVQPNKNNNKKSQEKPTSYEFDKKNKRVVPSSKPSLPGTIEKIGEKLFVSPIKGFIKLNPPVDIARSAIAARKGNRIAGRYGAINAYKDYQYRKRYDKDLQRASVAGGLIIGGLASPAIASAGTIGTTAVKFGSVGVKTGAVALGGLSIRSAVQNPTEDTISDAAIAVPIGIGGAVGLASGAVKGLSFIGKREVPNAKVFSNQVLSGKKTLPITRSSAETIRLFERTRDAEGLVYGQTSSPVPITGNVAGVGKKASTGFEDAGIYVTPKGEGSPYFLKTIGGDSSRGVRVTFNPFSDFSNFGRSPTVTEFGGRGVVTIPKRVARIPGFQGVKEFQQDVLSKQGVFQITKRAQIGQGEIRSQRFTDLRGRNIRESGTSELEAVVPFGTKFVEVPSREFTRFGGEKVQIRKAVLVAEDAVSTRNFPKGSTSRNLNKNFFRNEISSQSNSPRNVQVRLPVFSNKSPVSKSDNILPSSKKSLLNRSDNYSDVKLPRRTSTVGSRLSPESLPISSSNISRGVSKRNSSGSSPSIVESIIRSRLSYRNSFSRVKGSSTSRGSSRGGSSTINPIISEPPSNTSKARVFRRSKPLQDEYFVFYRRRGKVQQLNNSGLELSKALQAARSLTAGTAARSFKIVNSRTGEAFKDLNDARYRVGRSKATKGFFVEKSRFAINTRGEFLDITSKNRRKKKDETLF